MYLRFYSIRQSAKTYRTLIACLKFCEIVEMLTMTYDKRFCCGIPTTYTYATYCMLQQKVKY